MDELNKFLKNLNLDENDTIVIGLSGGPDSMALVDIINKFYKNIKIVCAHVHHNLRKESDLEKDFVEKYCQDNKLFFEFLKIEKYKNNKFSEEEARIIRYNFFESLIKKYNAKYLFTAHHGDDLIETILMRLTRGSSFKGYSGINIITKKDNYEIVRPLIFLTKDEIMNYIKEFNIPYVSDESNNSLKYTRNRYRIKILPSLKEENINVHQKFYKFSKMINEYDSFIEDYVLKNYDNIFKNGKINLKLFNQEKDLIKRRMIEKYLYSFYQNDIVLINDKHVEDILKLSKMLKPNISIDLPNNLKFIKDYDFMYIKHEEIINDYQYELKDKIIINNKTIEIVNESNLTDNFVIYLNSKDFELPIYVRNYKTGDKIQIKNMKNEKKVKDIFINEKISLGDRKTWPIVVSHDNKILWIPGLKKSNFDSQNTGIYDIILRYY